MADQNGGTSKVPVGILLLGKPYSATIAMMHPGAMETSSTVVQPMKRSRLPPSCQSEWDDVRNIHQFIHTKWWSIDNVRKTMMLADEYNRVYAP